MLQVIRGLVFPSLAVLLISYWLLKCDKFLKLGWGKAFLVAFLHEVGCAICAKAMSFVEAGFIWREATTYRLYGMIFFMPFFYMLFANTQKLKKDKVFDIFAIAVVLRLILGRVNCLRMGCCEGVMMPGTWNIRWPIREIELCYYFIFVALFAGRIIKGKTSGQVYPIYLFTYGLLRFAMEWVREEYVMDVAVFHLAHIWSLVSIVIGVTMYYKVRKEIQSGKGCRNKEKTEKRRK